MKDKNETRKVFELGKVALGNPNRKSNMMQLDVSLRKRSREDGEKTIDLKETPAIWYEFSASGGFWNNIHSDYIQCGQCLDTMIQFQRDITPENRAILKKVFGWWKLYHLNDMNAGSRNQIKAVKDFRETLPKDKQNIWNGDDMITNHLKKIGLYYDTSKLTKSERLASKMRMQLTGKSDGYKYGSAWLVELIPDDVLADMKKLVGLEEE